MSPSIRNKKSLFSALRGLESSPPPSEPLRLEVDARLPNPPIVTCNEPLPLRIIVKRISDSPGPIFLQTLHIELVAYTNIRAHELSRKDCGSWVLVSVSNMRKQLGTATDPAGTEVTVDNVHWKDRSLPNTVAPSFETCNLSRSYGLEVKLGIMAGSGVWFNFNSCRFAVGSQRADQGGIKPFWQIK